MCMLENIEIDQHFLISRVWFHNENPIEESSDAGINGLCESGVVR